MINNIIDFLDLEDANILIDDVKIDSQKLIKYITLKTSPVARYCPICGFRMHSKGAPSRRINHPILSDGYQCVLLLKQRRWKCTNNSCGFTANEGYNFVAPRHRYTNAGDILIVEAHKDLNMSCRAIAKKFKTSDRHVMDVFEKYVHMDRLPLTEAICIDEVHLEMDSQCKYVMIILDFFTGEPIDMLISRRSNCTLPYFSRIPKNGRNKVMYLITDMYNPYLEFANQFFPNAVNVFDSFHVSQWIINSIINYIRHLERELRVVLCQDFGQ